MADIVYVLENDQAGEHAFNFELSGSGGGSDESDGGDTLEILPLHSQQSDGGQEVTYIQVIIKTLSYISIIHFLYRLLLAALVSVTTLLTGWWTCSWNMALAGGLTCCRICTHPAVTCSPILCSAGMECSGQASSC